ncbi:TonB-dependent receptor [Thalassotalea euphylliae]|uniref:TonB-dependent receptor n=1 Tax=Thalassotalea euphylliae TaxID=1655234 RepID=A0A3E0TTH7_9GAMM|nr:TonB-dependent receptor [Thalassotalea euphylliae]REL27647.1 TonB-dependent receptor [Thalassotalea euphylliae]
MYSNKLTKAIRLALVVGATAGVSSPVFAQENNAEEESVERIEVTGSRILREGAVAPTPVTVISGADLVNTGALNIGDALNDLPALASTYTLSNSSRFIGTSGLNLLDLRNLGTNRTLVLVNGKRHVSSVASGTAVDTNAIPSAWVERVEIITGGASAVYGADAVTGVVNFVLKDNVEGLDTSYTRGESQHSDYSTDKFTLSYGTNFDDDRGNVAFAFEYASQDSLNALDNPWTRTSTRELANPNQPADEVDNPAFPDDIFYENAGFWGISDRGVIGAFGTIDNPYTFDDNGNLVLVNTGTITDGLSCAGDNCDFFNLGKYSEVQPQFERSNFNVKSNYDITDDIRIYGEAKYVRVEGESLGQPAFSFGGGGSIPTFLDSSYAFFNDEIKEKIDAGSGFVVLNRLHDDIGRRVEDNTRETTRFVVGTDGVFGDDWSFDVSFNYGKTEIERVNGANLIIANYNNAIAAVDDGNGNIICADEEARANGCVPFDVTRYNTASDELKSYLTTTSVGTSEIEQTVLTANISNGSIYELPAGDVGFATGIEYRKEESESIEDDNAEGTFFNALGEDKGDFDVTEAYFELSVPVLTDVFLAEDVIFETALRFADYSTIGDTTSWKLGVDWTIVDGLRVRATKSEALRAPNIGEIFGAESQTFYNVDDPCKSSELDLSDNNATRRANCAALGVAADFDSDYDDATLPGVVSGNEDVQEETSRSTTVGIVYQPDYVEGLSITVDYWNIELEDAISTIDAQEILDRCVDSESGIDNQFCNLITRNPANNEITRIQNSVLNVAGRDLEGIDFEIGYDFDFMGGEMSTTLLGTHMIKFREFPFQDNTEQFIDNEGTAGTPDWEGTLRLRYTHGDWTVTSATRYMDEVFLYTPQDFERNPNPSDLLTFTTYFKTDMTVGYEFENGVGVSFGIENLFDRELPRGTRGTGGSSATYDNIGRFYHMTFSYKM